MRDQVATVENVNNFEGGVVIPFTVLGQQNTKLMDMLTDKVYKDSAMAVVREYTTNALDSHIAAGQTRQIHPCAALAEANMRRKIRLNRPRAKMESARYSAINTYPFMVLKRWLHSLTNKPFMPAPAPFPAPAWPWALCRV